MNFLFKAMLKKQLKGVPEEQIDMIISAMEKNPEFFKQLGEKIKAKVDGGMSQQDAAMQVMGENAEELQRLLGK
jgi:glycerol kinase